MNQASALASGGAATGLPLMRVSEDKTAIESKIKTGMHSFKDFKLPVRSGHDRGRTTVNFQIGFPAKDGSSEKG